LDGKYKRALKVAQERENEWEKINKSIEAQGRAGVIQKAESLRTQFSTLSSLQGSKAGKKEKLIADIDALSKRLECLEAEGKDKFPALLSDFNRLHDEFLSLSGTLASANTIEEARGAVQGIQKVLGDLAQVVKKISEHDFRGVQGGNKEFRELRDRLIGLKSVNGSYEEELKGLDQKIRAAQSQLEKIKPEESRLQASIQSLREKSAKFREEARRLRGSAESIHEKIQDLTAKREAKRVSMATAEKEFEAAEA
jgi:chromosome segregation ATPase